MLASFDDCGNQERAMINFHLPLATLLLLAGVSRGQEPIVLSGHGGWIGAVAFRSDSRYLAVGAGEFGRGKLARGKVEQGDPDRFIATLKGSRYTFDATLKGSRYLWLL